MDAYEKLTEEMTASINQARNKLNQYRAHPVIDIQRELTALDALPLATHRVRGSAIETSLGP